MGGREGEGIRGRGKGRGAKVLHTDIHTELPTKRVLEEHSLLKTLLL